MKIKLKYFSEMVVCEKQERSAIIIQACYRGYLIRKKLSELSDNMTYSLMSKLIDRYNENLIFFKEKN